MIHEFAVEPEALSTWQAFRYLTEKFGVDQGRLIARFPAGWKRLVYEACESCGDIEKKRIEVGLQQLDKKLLRSGRVYDAVVSWLDNAERSHADRPFRAVLAQGNPRAAEFVRLAADLDETDPLFHVPRGQCIPRRAEAMAEAARPLLSLADEILFVDPHFDPGKPRFMRPMAKFLEVLGSRTSRPLRVEIHVKHDLQLGDYMVACRTHLSRLLPQGFGLTILRWESLDGGQALHARYILTELGGLRFEHGLDEAPRKAETVDVELLAPEIFKARWDDYQVTARPAFRLVEQLSLQLPRGEARSSLGAATGASPGHHRRAAG
jgi:hypothetical protein